METNAKSIVTFTDRFEEPYKHFGILFDNGFILCLCCGSYIEPEDYIIYEHHSWHDVKQILLKEA